MSDKIKNEQPAYVLVEAQKSTLEKREFLNINFSFGTFYFGTPLKVFVVY